MSDSDLIRAHDPFSGHQDPTPVEDITEPEKRPEAPTPPPEPAAKAPARRGRRPRRTPTAAEAENARRKVRRS